jgi:hypothetical protein
MAKEKGGLFGGPMVKIGIAFWVIAIIVAVAYFTK